MSIRQFVDGRAEKAGRFETSGSASRTGDCGTSGTGERASRKGVCKMFIFRLSFANCSLIVRLTFGEGYVCDDKNRNYHS